VRELTPALLERHQKQVAAKHGPSVAKLNRTVLSGVCGLAVRRGALPTNPVRDIGVVRSDAKKPPVSLEVAQAKQFLAYLTYDEQAIARDLPDIVAVMLATSVRIGECLAITWDSLDFDAGTAEIKGNVVRVKGQGLQVNEYESNKLTRRILRLPDWAVERLRQRRQTLVAGGDLVFPAVRSRAAGKLRDPSNTSGNSRMRSPSPASATSRATSFARPSPRSWMRTAGARGTQPINLATRECR
jgi:integrase